MDLTPISVSVWTMRILASMFSRDADHRHVHVLRADGFQRAFIRGVALDGKGRNVTDRLNFRFFPINGEDFTALFDQRFCDAGIRIGPIR